MKIIPLIFISLLLGTNLLFGQGGDNGQSAERDRVFAESKQRVENDEYYKRRVFSKLKPTKKMSPEDFAKVSPPLEDSVNFAQFLKNKKTGIAKLLQRPNCDPRVVNVNDTICLEALQIIGNGSIYSFSERNHIDSLDIMLKGDELFVFSLGLIADLGDVSLEKFDFSKDTKALKKFSIKKEMSEFSTQRKQFAVGIEISGRSYTSKVAVKPNNTYLIRSFKRGYLAFEEITVAFRVIRKDNDGSIVLVWKEL